MISWYNVFLWTYYRPSKIRKEDNDEVTEIQKEKTKIAVQEPSTLEKGKMNKPETSTTPDNNQVLA